MASTFLDYEKANNPFISSLMRGDFPSSVSNISSLGGVLLIPQAVAFDDPVKAFKKFTVTKDFIRDHTALFDPKRPLNFVTLSGLLGKCTTDDPNEKIPSGFYIFDRVSPDKMSSFIDEYNYMIISNSASIFFNSILTLFKDAERLDESKRNVNYIMRSGVLVVGTKSVPFFIIPEILPPTCDPSLMSEPSLDTCAVPISSSSFADPEDNSDNKNSSADDADGDNSEPKEDGDCGEETSSDAAKEFEKQNHYISDFFQKLRLSDAVDVRNSLNK